MHSETKRKKKKKIAITKYHKKIQRILFCKFVSSSISKHNKCHSLFEPFIFCLFVDLLRRQWPWRLQPQVIQYQLYYGKSTNDTRTKYQNETERNNIKSLLIMWNFAHFANCTTLMQVIKN